MAHNLQQCQILIRKAAVAKAKVSLLHLIIKAALYLSCIGNTENHGSPHQALFLPEASDYIASSAEETVSLVKSVHDSEFIRGLQSAARSTNMAINVGVHEPGNSSEKVKNTLLWIDEKGEIVQRYQKLHLFDVEIEGGPVLRESKLCVAPLCVLFGAD